MLEKLGFLGERNRKAGRGRAARQDESFAEAWSRSKNGPDGAEGDGRQLRMLAAAGLTFVASALILSRDLL